MTPSQLQEIIRVLGPNFRVRFLVRNGAKATPNCVSGHSEVGAISTKARTFQGISTVVGGRRGFGGAIWRS